MVKPLPCLVENKINIKKDSLPVLITGGTGMIFKGDGFYITDYKKNKKLDDKKEQKSKKNKKDNKKEKKNEQS